MVLILDGGSTFVLDHLPDKQHHDELMASPLWTSQALFTQPQAVTAMYRSYIEAGADLVSCMTYQQSSMTMAHVQDIPDAYDVGMRIALEACIGTTAKPVLALGTHAAMLSNGAEYSHKYIDPEDREMLRKFHYDRLLSFSRQKTWSQIDYIAFETLPDVMEAEVILDVLRELPDHLDLAQKKIWISFSCSGPNVVTKILRGVQKLLERDLFPGLWGLGINCFKEHVAEALITPFCALLEGRNLYAVMYPDAGRLWDAVAREFVGAALRPEQWARNFRQMSRLNGGKVVLGGCCQTGPEHIAAIRKRIIDT